MDPSTPKEEHPLMETTLPSSPCHVFLPNLKHFKNHKK